MREVQYERLACYAVITGLCLLSCTIVQKNAKGLFLCYHWYLHIWEPTTSWRLRINVEVFCKLWTCRIFTGKKWFTAESESPKQISWEFLQLSCVWYHYLYCFCVYNVFWGMVHIFFVSVASEPNKDIKKLRNFFHKYDDEKSVTKVSRFHRNRRRRLMTFFYDRLTSQQEVLWK